MRANELDTFYSVRDTECEHEQQTPCWTDAKKPVVVIIPKRVERLQGWNDVEILSLQIDKNGYFDPRYVCQCVGNEDTDLRFFLSMGKKSKFVKALKARGFITDGKFDLMEYVGKKFQINFSHDIINEKQVMVVDDVQEFRM